MWLVGGSRLDHLQEVGADWTTGHVVEVPVDRLRETLNPRSETRKQLATSPGNAQLLELKGSITEMVELTRWTPHPKP